MPGKKKNYLYDYQISELLPNGIKVLIAYYYSNAAPPQIKSLIDPSKFAEEEYRHNRYKVIQVEMLPHSTDDQMIVSDQTTVFITVEKIQE